MKLKMKERRLEEQQSENKILKMRGCDKASNQGKIKGWDVGSVADLLHVNC